MRAELFYKKADSRNGIPLSLIDQKMQYLANHDIAVEEKQYLKNQGFTGKTGEVGLLYSEQGILRKAYIGINNATEYSSVVAQAAQKLPAGSYYFESSVPQTAILNWSLTQYAFDHFKENKTKARILCLEASSYEEILSLADAIFLVRDLINMPANSLHPEMLADITAELAKEHQASFHQWVGQELLDAHFPGIYTVGKSSVFAPRLLSLSWGEANAPLLVLVGKGVCFDSGGFDIKPSSSMRLMKKDMGGAAQVLGLAKWIMQNQLPIRLQVLIPAVENLIGPEAFKPGDIIRMRNELTVEIDNTDAEGRLILADALVLATELEPELIIDFATLTGAARVAVGPEIAAMFTNNEMLAAELLDAANLVEDPIWQLPLFEAYDNWFKSSIADLMNSSPQPYAGAITAALFLKHFLKPHIPWVHFDIMAWNLVTKPGKPEGGEAMGIRAVAHYLQKKYNLKK